MEDKLEEFIRGHRDEFDTHEPPALWPGIERKLRRRDSRMCNAYYSAAASVLLVVGSFVWFFQRPASSVSAPPENTAVAISPEINEAEVYYTSIVQAKQAEVNQYAGAYPEICHDFEEEGARLHTMYTQLKTEYRNSNGNEAVLNAMMENLQTQVQLLGKQIEIIQRVRQKGNKRGANIQSM